MKLSPIDLANLARYRNLGLRALREIPIQNGNLEGDDLADGEVAGEKITRGWLLWPSPKAAPYKTRSCFRPAP